MGNERTLTLKACRRCGGDMHQNRDHYGEFKQCLQCGYLVDLKETYKMKLPSVRKLKRSAA